MEDVAASLATDATDDDEHDSKERVLFKYFLKEWELVKSLLDCIAANGGVADPSDVQKIRTIMDKYQEQGELLEPYLESIVSPLMLIVRSKTIQVGVDSDKFLKSSSLYSVIKFFPHQVSDLELAVSLLEKCHTAASVTSLRQESTGEMETKCVMLLWLYILVLIPFDISSIDTSIGDSNYLGGLEPPPLVLRLLGFSKDYLSSAGPMRKISCLLLARLITRPDMASAFHSFIEWGNQVFVSVRDEVVDHFRLLGVVEALTSIFKVGTRNMLNNVATDIWSKSSVLLKSTAPSRSPLLRKFLMKLFQNIGLVCLPHRSPSWRYRLVNENSFGETISLATNDKGGFSCYGQTIENNIPGEGHLEEDDGNIPEVIEEIIELLLSGLRDSDTVVRWSAAKGIGRITARLTASLSEDVLSSVLELFSPGEGDGSWHGGCLALAELARRGLLLPASFPRVVPVITKALHYDVRRGPHSVGSHVRDAAAYVCWAFGRAYSYTDMKAESCCSCFQENVGRQGAFPHGIDLVNTADYFSLASRSNSYLHVAVLIAQHKDYLYPFAEELMRYKVPHWEKSLRELASQALSSLAKYDHEYFAEYILEKLFPCTLSPDLCMRHGATLAAGEIVLALHHCGFVFATDKQKTISGIVPAIEKARLYRGKGGEMMRSSVSRFIECISLASIFLPNKLKGVLLETLNENLRHPNAQIQNSAVSALKHFVPAYLLTTRDNITPDIMSKHLSLLGDSNVAARRGAALALGVMPAELLVTNWRVVIGKLCGACKIQDDPDDRDVESRVNSVLGLVSVCETLTSEGKSVFFNGDEELQLYLLIKNEVLQTLFMALDDYTVDNRGDVGSWVREAAMEGLERSTYILCKRDSLGRMRPSGDNCLSDIPNVELSGTLAVRLVGGIAKQAVEKIDKIRDAAARRLQRLLHNNNYFVPFIPHREILEGLIPGEANFQWGVSALSFPRFVQLLQFTCYSKTVLSGLVVSIGGLQDSLRKIATSSLLGYVQASDSSRDTTKDDKEHGLSVDLRWILQQYQKCDRVIIPTLKTIEILLSKNVFLGMEVSQHAAVFLALMDSLVIELKGTKDFSKLLTGLSILGYVASLSEPIKSQSFSQILSFLAHRYPKIRKSAADQLYLVLLQNGNLMAEDKLGEALEILTETCWEGELDGAKHRRLELCKLAGVDISTHPNISRGSSKSSAKNAFTDENSSYSSLVGSSGF
ncbi:unnamed protein product [Spirodela intermedia]|uniref:Uncharacterized protein n=1 Tax=Spirodela intermedia TaxID=51605 RepID=A0A7I8IFZ4_SPIIN|nr:unnamed protein product [Spirodela intermedia]CAA6656204.1 unnamed protein product [Spirodela intermedia]